MEWRKHGEPESLEIQEGDLRTLPSREYAAGLACACCPEIWESPSTIRNTVKRACGGAICASVFLLILVQSFNHGRRQSAPTVPPPPAPWSPPPKWPPPPSGPMPCIAGAVVINELDAHGVPEDWVELKNIGAVTCTLQGWQLFDHAGMGQSAGTHVVNFGADAVVQPGGFYVGYKNHARGNFNFSFGIGNSETVYLRAPDGTLNAMADLHTGHPTGLCLGLVVDTDPGAPSGSTERGTPGAENTCYVVPPPSPPSTPPSPPSTPPPPHLNLNAFRLQRNWTFADVADNLSGGTVVAGPGNALTIFTVINDPPQMRAFALSATAAPTLTRIIDLEGWEDTEGMTALVPPSGSFTGNLTLAVTEERRLDIVLMELPPLPAASAQPLHQTNRRSDNRVILPFGPPRGPPTHSPNKGAEGVAYDPFEHVLYIVIEKWPMRVLKLDIASGNVTVPFDAQAVLGGLVTDLAGICFEPRHRHLILLSQESSALVQMTTSGRVLAPPVPVAGTQPEGVALSPDGNTLYVISEPNELFEYRCLTCVPSGPPAFPAPAPWPPPPPGPTASPAQ